MKKADALRELLIGVVPALRDKPENLSLYIAKGRVGAIAARALSFEYRYQLQIVVQDYAGDQDMVFVPLLAWISENQPELMRRPDTEPFTYEIEIIDVDACDIEIAIELTEKVRVERTAEGYAVTHVADAPMKDAFAGICDVNLLTVLVDDLRAGATLTFPDADG